MDINLKPCPFCGGEPVVDDRFDEYGELEFSVACANDSCFISSAKTALGWVIALRGKRGLTMAKYWWQMGLFCNHKELDDTKPAPLACSKRRGKR